MGSFSGPGLSLRPKGQKVPNESENLELNPRKVVSDFHPTVIRLHVQTYLRKAFTNPEFSCSNWSVLAERSAFGGPGRLVILSIFLGLYRCFCTDPSRFE